MSRVLITGANGFVGRAVSERFLANGWQVRGTVRNPGRAKGLPSGMEVVPFSSETRVLGPMFENVDAVVHLAANVHVLSASTAQLPSFMAVNAFWTERLAHAAATAGVRRFVFMSTIKIHGEFSSAPFTETDPPAPRDPYAVSKWEAERLLRKVEKETGLEVTVLRPPLVYGAGAKANFLRLLGLVERNLPLPLGAVRNSRSLLFLDTLADAVAACAQHPGAAGETFLVTDGEDLSTPELIRRIAGCMGRRARLLPVPASVLRLLLTALDKEAIYDRLCGSLAADPGRIHSRLGWAPPYSVSEGLERTVDWYQGRDRKGNKLKES